MSALREARSIVSSFYGGSLWQERKAEQSACCEVLLPNGLSSRDTVSSGSSWPCVTCATFVRYLGRKEGGAQRRALRLVLSGQSWGWWVRSSPLPVTGQSSCKQRTGPGGDFVSETPETGRDGGGQEWLLWPNSIGVSSFEVCQNKPIQTQHLCEFM